MLNTMGERQSYVKNVSKGGRFTSGTWLSQICVVLLFALLSGCSGARDNGDPAEPSVPPNNGGINEAETVNLNDFPISPFQAQVVINEVSSQGNDEIEFLNLGTEAVDLSGWFYADSGWVPGDTLTEDHRYVFPAGTMLDGATYLVMRKDEAHTFGLSGSGDSVWLLDAERRVVDGVTWAASEAEPSLCRLPNGMGDFETCAQTTFGFRNQASASLDVEDAGVLDAGMLNDGGAGMDAGDTTDGGGGVPQPDAGMVTRAIVINEVSSSGDDVIELKNVGFESLDLSGWYVTDDSYDPADSTTFDKRYVLPAGISLAAGAYLALYKNTNHTFGLGGDDAVFLYDLNDELIDSCDWAADEASVSYCRIPDGSGTFRSCSTASFEASNTD